MDYKHVNVVEILSIDNVELYQTSAHSGNMITKGTLDLLYCEEYSWYILKVNDFNYGVSKSIPVLASSHERGAARAYVVPNSDGYFIVKITKITDQANFDKFEEILKNNTQFAHKEGTGQDGLPVRLGDKSVTVKDDLQTKDFMDGKRPTGPAHLIYDGGKAARKMIVSSAQGVANGISKLGTHAEHHIDRKEVPQPKATSGFSLLSSAAGMIGSTSTVYIKGITSLGNWIGQKIETKFERRKVEKEAEALKNQPPAPVSVVEETVGVGYATIYTVISVWQGMLEALDILREGVTDTATGLVSQRYGPVAGEVFKAGASIAASSIKGSKYLKR